MSESWGKCPNQNWETWFIVKSSMNTMQLTLLALPFYELQKQTIFESCWLNVAPSVGSCQEIMLLVWWHFPPDQSSVKSSTNIAKLTLNISTKLKCGKFEATWTWISINNNTPQVDDWGDKMMATQNVMIVYPHIVVPSSLEKSIQCL